MKVIINDKEYVEKEELYFELNRLLLQDKKDMSEEEFQGCEIALQRLQNLLF